MLSKQKTKKYQKKALKKKTPGLLLFFFGVILFSFSIYNIFFVAPPPIISPLAKNSVTEQSLIEDWLSKNKIEVRSITFQKDSSYMITLKDNSVIFISSKVDILKQLSSLQLIIKRLKIEGKRFERLDFRYDKPIIVF
ncbi:MAG: hypothetical protein A3I49_02045 [Candidatus Levybacteria bacterium RIFCSPLOWO2_02_FULL_37_11]|nr:MAG: hypothetical protein A3I49_02045 [Candidatus Levybacteria bacterium RIFCSPLOWO2_02_FULL_37_11]